MYAEELLSTIALKKIVGKLPNVVKDIAIDSRSVQPSTLFICIKGYTVDGHDYAQKAVDAGATIIVTERELSLRGRRGTSYRAKYRTCARHFIGEVF